MSVKTEPSKYLQFLLMLSRLDRALGTSLVQEFSEVLSEERQLVREAFGQNQSPPLQPLPNPWYGHLGVEEGEGEGEEKDEEDEEDDEEVKVVDAPEPTIHLVNLVDQDSEGSSYSSYSSYSSWVQAEVVAEDPSSPPSVGSEPLPSPPTTPPPPPPPKHIARSMTETRQIYGLYDHSSQEVCDVLAKHAGFYLSKDKLGGRIRLSRQGVHDSFLELLGPVKFSPNPTLQSLLDALFQAFQTDPEYQETICLTKLSLGLTTQTRVVKPDERMEPYQVAFRVLGGSDRLTLPQLTTYLESVYLMTKVTTDWPTGLGDITPRELAESTADECFSMSRIGPNGTINLEQLAHWSDSPDPTPWCPTPNPRGRGRCLEPEGKLVPTVKPEGKLVPEDPPTPVARKIVRPSRKGSTSLRRGTRSRRAPERLIDQD